jgi:hypothetical protein
MTHYLPNRNSPFFIFVFSSFAEDIGEPKGGAKELVGDNPDLLDLDDGVASGVGAGFGGGTSAVKYFSS